MGLRCSILKVILFSTLFAVIQFSLISNVLFHHKESKKFGDFHESRENINLAYVIGGQNWVRFWYLNHLKSLINSTNHILTLHLVTDPKTFSDIQKFFKTWNLDNVFYTFYDINEHLDKVNWIPTAHYSKSYGLLKIVVPEIISANNIILIDVDTIINTDIGNLWRQFEYFNKSQIFGAAENLSNWYNNSNGRRDIWPALENGYNSGVLLIDLQKLRKLDWKRIWRNIAINQLRIRSRTIMGDQDIFNTIFKEYPTWIFKINCGFNFQQKDNSERSNCKQYSRINHYNSKDKSIRKIFNYTVLKGIEDIKNSRNKKNVKKLSTNKDPCSSSQPFTEYTVFPNILSTPEWENHEICLVSQISTDRFPNFLKMLKHWPFSVSVSIFGNDSELNLIVEELLKMNRTNMAVNLVFRKNVKNQTEFYPINFLRNLALEYAQTEYVLLIDGDFIVLGDIKQLVENARKLKKKEVLVIPAFEFIENIDDEKIVLENKFQLIKLVDNKQVQSFRQNIWPNGHSATDYLYWYSTNIPYTVEWKMYYEPYLIARKSEIPKFDERFGGFGWNKVSHSIQLKIMNFTFLVTPSTFLLHQSHAPSADLLRFRESSQYRKCQWKLTKNVIQESLLKYPGFV